MIRKINGVLALLSAAVLIFHIIYTATLALQGLHGVMTLPLTIITVLTIGIHAILSIIITISSHKDGNGIGKYPKVHFKTILQRATGIFCIIVIAAHIYIVNNVAGVPWFKASDYVVIILGLVALIHLSFSFSKAFVTLGIVTREKTVHTIELIGNIICIALVIYAVYMAVSSLVALS